MMFHGDSFEIPTPGDRGKTTRRKSTRTVRGPEGRWIAEVKERLAKDRPPEPPPVLGIVSTAYLVTCDHPAGLHVTEYDVNAWWFEADQLTAALRMAASHPCGRLQRKDTIRYIPAGKRKPRERVEWTEVSTDAAPVQH
jgi:hypothetical protein